MSRAVGIDLGTSNSAVAVLEADGRPRLILSDEGGSTIPSLVWFADEGAVVGDGARAGLEEQPERTIYGIKRLLGRSVDDADVQRLQRTLPYRVIAAPNRDTLIALDDATRISPERVAGMILRKLRKMAERAIGEPVTEAVITIPAWFDSAQRQATKDAAAIAGLSVKRLMSEPTAAALGHAAHRGVKMRYAVCDFGGGTFDVSIVDAHQSVFEVLSTAGDPFLGGDDVDRILVSQISREIRAAQGVDITADASAVDRLRLACQLAKHDLSKATSTDVWVSNLMPTHQGRPLEVRRPLTRAELELWVSALLQRMEGPCREALRKAHCDPSSIDQVLLVGGMTRMPAVAEQVASIFGRKATVIPNPDEVVAIGAAAEVARLEGRISGVLLVDVCARGMALSIGNGPCESVIQASAPLPVREHRVLATTASHQRQIEFDLWEGDASEPGRNRHLGRYVIAELPDAVAGDVLVALDVTLDTDGTVHVTATEVISGEPAAIEVVTQAGLARVEVERVRRELDVGA